MDQAQQSEVSGSQGTPRARAARGVLPWLLLLGLMLTACGSSDDRADDDGAAGAPGDVEYPASLPYARTVEAFTPGESAGFGQSQLPDVVLGPPRGKGERAGSLDVLSLGSGGEIVLGFGERGIVDGAGPDFVVFENPFWPGGDATQVYAELGEISVSEDGETWLRFECDTTGDGAGHFAGCAGVTPTEKYDPLAVDPLDPSATGGDAFDLADVGLERARFVKVRDLETLEAAGNSAGFDLDAVGIVHAD
jgi:hypothetical protein